MTWQTKKLREVCDLVKGKKPTVFVSKSNKPYLTAKVVRKTEEPKFASEKCPSSVWVKKEDIIIIMDGSNSGEMFTGLEGALASTMGIVKYQKDLLNPKYLLHFLITHRENFTKSRTGSAIPHLNKEEFENLEISFPPLPEQRRIVKILDEVFEGIAKAKANAEKNLQNSKELFDLSLRNILDNSRKKWGVKLLGELCERVEYGSSSKSKKAGRVPVLRMGNIQNGKLNWDDLKYSNDKQEIEKYLLKYNDVLFNRTNSPELVGKTAIYKNEMPAIFAGYLIRIHRKEKLLDADYLNYFLNSNEAKEHGNSVVISSVNQANINGQKLKNYPIPAPPLVDQKSIVKKLDALSAETKKLEANYRQKLADLEELKKSVLKKAFNGEL
ncbi:MAG: restriction endonuclease subunit S [Candidatus Moraniibacteriota bacterium]